jgi:hypothetical protein
MTMDQRLDQLAALVEARAKSTRQNSESIRNLLKAATQSPKQ